MDTPIRYPLPAIRYPLYPKTMTAHSPDAATLGEPSYVWRSGQDRRLTLIREYVPLEERWILDIGCGVGTYVRRLRDFSPHVVGIDIALHRLREGAANAPNLIAAVGEFLPFAECSFDVILLNEVIEHVHNDRETLLEAMRVLRPGGHVVIYAPNRLYPFETHGIYVGRRYIFGNIPLVNYLPGPIRGRLVPHARAYRTSEIQRLVAGLPARVLVHGYVYPGFDNIASRSPRLAKRLRSALYRAEQTPLRRFGLSHFVVLQRD